MKILKKRIIPGILASALALTMAAPAFASSTVISGNYVAGNISVTVPGSTTATINPYGLPVALNAIDPPATDEGEPTPVKLGEVKGQQIVTQPLFIVNQGTSPLTVNATVTGKITGNLKFSPTDITSDMTTNSAYVYLQYKMSELASTSIQSTDKVIEGTAISTTGGVKRDVAYTAFADWDDEFDATKNIVVGTTTSEQKFMGYLMGVKESGGAITEYSKGSIGMVRLSGKVVEDPKMAWTAKDGFSVTVAFTFKAVNDKATIGLKEGQTLEAGNKMNFNDQTKTHITLKVASLGNSKDTLEGAEYTWTIDKPGGKTNLTLNDDGDEQEAEFTLSGSKTDITADQVYTISVTVTTKAGLKYTGTFKITVYDGETVTG